MRCGRFDDWPRTEPAEDAFNQPTGQEISMSGINGDKARFNRRRRQKISRRQSNEKMLKALAEKTSGGPAEGSQSQGESGMTTPVVALPLSDSGTHSGEEEARTPAGHFADQARLAGRRDETAWH